MAGFFHKQKVLHSPNTQKFGDQLNFAAAEAYNLLRTNVSFALPGKEGGKIIGVTSPCPQEGKSYTSINLCYALAKNGSKVLLIDADMRRPSIAKSLGVKPAPGLSNILSRQADIMAYTDILHENVSVIVSGDIPPNPSELLGSEAMKQLLEKMSQQYDYIIIDLPPVVSVSDALIISKFIDGIMVVLRHGHTRRKNVQETVRQLRFVEARILGFVYNGYRRGGGYYKKARKYYKYYKYYRSDSDEQSPGATEGSNKTDSQKQKNKDKQERK